MSDYVNCMSWDIGRFGICVTFDEYYTAVHKCPICFLAVPYPLCLDVRIVMPFVNEMLQRIEEKKSIRNCFTAPIPRIHPEILRLIDFLLIDHKNFKNCSDELDQFMIDTVRAFHSILSRMTHFKRLPPKLVDVNFRFR